MPGFCKICEKRVFILMTKKGPVVVHEGGVCDRK